jgi:hypothetical protein
MYKSGSGSDIVMKDITLIVRESMNEIKMRGMN